MKYGIEGLKKAVDLGIEIEKVLAHLIANGTNWANSMKDLFEHVPVLVVEVQAAVVAWPQIPLEIKDLDGQEAVDLVAYVAGKLSVDNAKAQAIIAASLKLTSDMIFDGVALAKAIQGPVVSAQ